MNDYRYDMLIAYADVLDKNALVQIAEWADKAIQAIDRANQDDKEIMTPNARFVYDRFSKLHSACKQMAEILK